MLPADITITLPDLSSRVYPQGVTVAQVAQSIGKRLSKDAVGGIVNGSELVDVHTPLQHSCTLRIITVGSPEGLEIVRHSTAHLMASAVQRLFAGTQVTIGPAIEQGFYYDFLREGGFSPDDLQTIQDEMQRLADLDLAFERTVVSRDVALAMFKDMGETFKCELIAAIPQDEAISLYRHGDWLDLCRGPHVPSTGFLKAFKLTHVAGAYWRGNEKNPMLARIYGTAFWTQKELAAHFAQLEEAKKRDHRRLGKQLDLFSFHPLAPAMPFFHPKGTLVYNLLVAWVRDYYLATGFQEVITPQIFDVELFKLSGHYDNYRDSMFFCTIDEREFGIKPMNCPGHTLLFSAQPRSYRDLPLRFADFGRLHRYERSGVTAGLTRVRGFSQDDAHIFCRDAQIAKEIEVQILMILDLYSHFGFATKVGLSTRPEKSLGREAELSAEQRLEWDHTWEQAEAHLRTAIGAAGLEYEVYAGDGAFYGPKIDCQVRDALGRWHQLGTIQLDFGLPKRFDLTYINEQSNPSRPVMIHRAVLGSVERFMGILLEHCAGDLPLWLAPTQVRVVTLTQDVQGYGEAVQAAFAKAGLRVSLDDRREKLGFKIRDAELHKIPVVAVIGEQEAQKGMVTLRWRHKDARVAEPLDQAVQSVLQAAATPTPGEKLCARAAANSSGI